MGWGHDGRLGSYQGFGCTFGKVEVSTARLGVGCAVPKASIGRMILPSLGVGSRYNVVGLWTKMALPWGLCVGVGWRGSCIPQHTTPELQFAVCAHRYELLWRAFPTFLAEKQSKHVPDLECVEGQEAVV